MVEINWTREAELWLRDTYNYIALDNSDAAERTVVGIFQKVQPLTNHPRLGHRYEPAKSQEVRILIYGHFRIAYLIKPDSRIDILGGFSRRFRYRALSPIETEIYLMPNIIQCERMVNV